MVGDCRQAGNCKTGNGNTGSGNHDYRSQWNNQTRKPSNGSQYRDRDRQFDMDT